MVEDPQSPRTSEPAISLDELTEAFAQALGIVRTVEGEAEPPSDEAIATRAPEVVVEQATADPSMTVPFGAVGVDDDACAVTPHSILEAMLFVGNRDSQPLDADRAAELMRGIDRDDIPILVNDLNRRLTSTGSPLVIVHEGTGYRLVLRHRYHALRNRLYGQIREAHLSQAAIDVLAIVAYQQPLTGEQIHRARGKPSSHVLTQLVRRGLLRIERKGGRQRALQYFTTDRFLELFGLQSLDDLPRSEELER